MRRACFFIFSSSSSFPSPVSPLSPLSLCLPRFSTFDRLTPKPCFIPAPQAVGDTSFRWRSTRRLTHHCRRTAGARIYTIFQPKAEPGSSGGTEKNITQAKDAVMGHTLAQSKVGAELLFTRVLAPSSASPPLFLRGKMLQV